MAKTVPIVEGYSINDFCTAHVISRAMYYKLRKRGRGPRETKVGTRTIIWKNDAADWRQRMQEESINTSAA